MLTIQFTMKPLKTILAISAAAFATVGLLSTAQAVPITGDIDFAGQAFFNTNSLATATQVVNFKTNDAASANGTAMVTSATGSFSGLSGSIASFPNVYTFNPSTATTPLWTVGGFTFNLTSSTVVFQNSQFLAISGNGILSGNGFDPTPGVWAFTSQQADGSPQTSFSFSANTSAVPRAVPDGGSALSLLGIALVGVEAVRRKLIKA